MKLLLNAPVCQYCLQLHVPSAHCAMSWSTACFKARARESRSARALQPIIPTVSVPSQEASCLILACVFGRLCAGPVTPLQPAPPPAMLMASLLQHACTIQAHDMNIRLHLGSVRMAM